MPMRIIRGINYIFNYITLIVIININIISSFLNALITGFLTSLERIILLLFLH